ncbi:MAG: TonB-dependent receptor [Steroidobacteraceae bacterium]
MNIGNFSVLALAGSLTWLAAVPGHAQDAAEDELSEVVVTGTRVANRSVLDTAVPVDVVSADTLNNVGVPELNQALSTALPSFNFPRPGLADGTDTIRPATLRGLAPDQTLVLVNSKRRHAASLVNVNGTVGRGSSAVDLNTIPSAMVRSIEVLRDGASAQYGSDAIAGVINVRLRENTEGGDLSLNYGVRDSEYSAPVGAAPMGATWTVPSQFTRSVSDGETLTLAGWKGFALGDSGFLTIAAEYKDQERTERTGLDSRQQYALVAGAFDPRELTINRFNAWYGEPEVQQASLFANAGYDLASGARLYGWVSYQDRSAKSAGFFRRSLDDRNVVQIYPDGFLPIIAPDVTDYSGAFGMQWTAGAWDLDSSLVYGFNEMEFTIENTLNRSIGPTSKTVFDAGGFDYDQLVLNVSGVRKYEIGALASPLNVAVGVEARRESYAITAGEPDSYRNGGVLLGNGSPTASGAQVFPGFRPANEVDEDRTAVGAYVDLEANLTDKLLGSVALRVEDYSDFGSNASGKLAVRYDFTDSFAIRGAVQNGFRAPSLQQQYFATTSTNFINGVPFDITTFPVTDPVAIALGAQPLDAEESFNASIGFVLQLPRFNLTVDAYRIDIDDRIVLSENLTQANVRDFLTAQGFIGVGGGRFFINGVDTETQGVDVVATIPVATASAGKFDITLTANFSDTEVTRVPTTAPLAALSPSPELFGRINVLTFEQGTPENKFTAAVNWALGGLGATLRATRYGDVLDPGTSAALDFVLPSETLVDLELRYNWQDKLKFALGAENLTDEYPDAFPTTRNGTGNTPFSNYSPFGRSGRYVYGRVTWSF